MSFGYSRNKSSTLKNILFDDLETMPLTKVFIFVTLGSLAALFALIRPEDKKGLYLSPKAHNLCY